jgi:hypothetical protein
MSHHSELPEFVFSPWQERQGLPAIITRVLRYPIHRIRWEKIGDRLQQALNDRAEQHQQSPATERRLATRAALTLALPELPPIAFDGYDLAADSLETWTRELRRIVNKEVTQDLLESDGRQPPS